MAQRSELNPHVRSTCEALIEVMKEHGCQAQLSLEPDKSPIDPGEALSGPCANLKAIMEGLRIDPTTRTSDSVPKEWLRVFCRYAADIETAETRHIWGALLAMAIAEPNSVFKRTLNALYHLESWEIEAFRAYCSFAFNFESGMPLFIEHADVLMDQRRYLLGEDNSPHFQAIGLLQNTTETLHPAKAQGLTLCYRETRYTVLFDGELKSDCANRASPLLLYRLPTAIGRQLARALPLSPRYGFARNTVALLVAQGLPFVLTADRVTDQA